MATQQLIIDVVTKNTQRLTKIEKALNRTNRSLSKTGNVAATAGKLIAGAFAVQQLLKFGGMVKDITSQFQTYHNQLRLITKGEEDRNRVFNKLVGMAKENRTEFGATVDLYSKLRITTEALGVSEERVANVTGKLSKALQLAGADGNTAASVIRQFGQAMASGEVRGDEFRSLVEGLGPALSIMARETGISVGQLRKMSQAGELNAMVMFEMLENSNSIDTEFNKMNSTIAQSETALKNAFERAVESSGLAKTATELYHNVIKDLATTLDRFAGARPFKDATNEMLEAAVNAGKLDDVLHELNQRINEKRPDDDGLDDYLGSLGDVVVAYEAEKKRMREVNVEYLQRQKHLEKLQESNKKFVDRQAVYIETMAKEAAAIKAVDEANLLRELKEEEALQKLTEKNQGFMDEILRLNEHESQEVLRIRNERHKRVKDLIDQGVIDEQDAADYKTEINKAYEKERQKMEDDRLAKNKARHSKNIDLIRSGKIQEINLENATAEQKKQIQLEAGMSILQNMATMNKTAFAAYKAVRIAEAVIAGKKATQEAFAYGMGVGGPIAAFLFAGAALAYTASQVNAIKSTNYTGRAKGGVVASGQQYLVGEKGPEVVTMGGNGYVTPNNQLGSTQEVTVNFNINAVDSQSFDQMLAQSKDTIVGVINEALNENGQRSLV